MIVAARAALSQLRSPGATIGFVPTMGALHAGHLSLIRQARRENSVVVCSIFVNPTQFGPNEDYTRYPRRLEDDSRLLEQEGVAILFAPTVSEMYQPGYATRLDVGTIGSLWEGAIRPGHFNGVAQVVTKLFNIVTPHRAYFGQKDAQQLAVIRQIVRDLNMPITIVACPTVRDSDGLALSSRNDYLTPAERHAAPVLYAALQAAATTFQRGERRAAALVEIMRVYATREPLCTLDYAAVVDSQSFQPLQEATVEALLIIAGRFGSTRLIDNLPLASLPVHEATSSTALGQ